jgi:Small-conductance mechanosensitive channel
MHDILNMTFLGIGVDLWLKAAAYIVGGFVVGVIAAWLCKNVFKAIFSKTKTKIDDILLDAIEKPLVAILVFVGIRQGIDILTVAPGVAPWFSKVITILIAGSVAAALAKLFDGLIQEYLVPYVQKSEGNLDDQLLPIIRKTVAIIIWVIFALFAIKEAGYDIGALLAGLGIGGVAIALAAKDTLSNFFGSVAIFVDKPFMINDRVRVAGYDGTIVEIGIRTSRLRTLDNHLVTLPNSVFAAGAIVNVSAEPATKVSTKVQLDTVVGYEGTKRALDILKDIGDKTSGCEKGALVSLTGFGDSSFDLVMYFFIKKGADYFGTINAVNLEILKRLEEANLPLAFPTRVIMERKEESSAPKAKAAKATPKAIEAPAAAALPEPAAKAPRAPRAKKA